MACKKFFITLICALNVFHQIIISFSFLSDYKEFSSGQPNKLESIKNEPVKSIRSVKILPSLQIILNVHSFNKFNELAFVLSGIEQQNYPKDRINILIQSEIYHTNNKTNERLTLNNLTIRLLKNWKKNIELQYHKFELRLIRLDEFDEKENEYWSERRYKLLMGYKSFAFQYALSEWADYCLFQDADVILTNPNTFFLLIHQKKTIISPVLFSLGMYSNFWAGVDEFGYYKRTDDYALILERQKVGVFSVPMIYSFVLINLRIKQARNLKFSFQDFNHVNEHKNELNKIPFDDIILFAKSAQFLEIPFYVDNNEIFGFIMPSIDKIDPVEQRENLMYLELECLMELNHRFNLSTSLEQYHYPIDEQSYHSINHLIDKIYVINLERRLERKAYMQSACDILQLKCEFVQAIDGQSIDKKYLIKNKIQIMKNYLDPFHKRPMTYGEIGCFMSHYNIWLNVVKSNYTWTIVLEDDVKFEKNFLSKFKNMFTEIKNLSDKIDLVYLGRKREGKAEDESWFNIFTVEPTYSYWTIGYLISLNGAKKLIKSEPLNKMVPVDEFLPIMYNRHPNTNWSNQFLERNLFVLSAHPVLIEPLHYIGDDKYISDTEDSAKLILHQEL